VIRGRIRVPARLIVGPHHSTRGDSAQTGLITTAIPFSIVPTQTVREIRHVQLPAFLKMARALRTLIVALTSVGQENAGRLLPFPESGSTDWRSQ